MAATVIAGIGVAVAAGSAAYSGVEASNAADKADRIREEQKLASEKVFAEQKTAAEEAQKQQDLAASQSAAQAANKEAQKLLRSRQKSVASAGDVTGRSSTILTSPLGVTGQPAQAGKTLLGS